MLLCGVCNVKYGTKTASIGDKLDVVCDDCYWVDTSTHVGTIVNPPSTKALARNKQCPCNSGKKYKKCCLIASRGQILAKNAEANSVDKVDVERVRGVLGAKKESNGDRIY